MTTITFEGIVKNFGATRAVDGVSLRIEPGKFCSLVGPSGCGKTTLLRIAAGFIQPDQGNLLLNGKSMVTLPPHRRNVGFVFQNYALFPTKTVAKNIGFSLMLQRRSRQEIAHRVEELAVLMGLDGLADRYPHELSGGQQQRVALARALASRPSILLLDEPLSALDAKIRAHLRIEIRRIVETLGITTLYVTHDQEEALSISDVVAIMNHGRLLQVGAPMDVYLHPIDRFVAHFIGTANSLPCRVVAAGEVEVGGVAVMANIACGVNGHGLLSVRPEHVTLNAPNGVPGTLAGLSFLGQCVRLTVDTLGGLILAVDVPTIEWFTRPLELGDKIAWMVRPGFANVFAPGAEA